MDVCACAVQCTATAAAAAAAAAALVVKVVVVVVAAAAAVVVVVVVVFMTAIVTIASLHLASRPGPPTSSKSWACGWFAGKSRLSSRTVCYVAVLLFTRGI